MRPAGCDRDIEMIGCREELSGPDRKRSDIRLGPVVHSVDLVDAEALDHAVVNHFATAPAAFFGGLEDDRDGSIEVPRLCKVFRGAKKHRGVPVMSAGMHHAWRFRRICQPRLLMDRQGIHVGAQAYRHPRSSGLAVDQPDDSRASDACHNLVASEFLELLLDDSGGAMHLEEQLRMRVEVTPPPGNFVMQFSKPVASGHLAPPLSFLATFGLWSGTQAPRPHERVNRPCTGTSCVT